MKLNSIFLLPLVVLLFGSQATSAQGTDALRNEYSYQLEEIVKAKSQVDRYAPGEYLYLVDYAATEWLQRAISRKEREKWYKNYLGSLPDDDKKKEILKMLDEAFKPLAASAAKKFPSYTPADNNFAFHNKAEEDMIKGKLKNKGTLTIHKIGFFHQNWQIEKDDYNIITRRYKKGFIWARDSSDDHPYCHLYWVNILQDHAGGGTYGDSYASFVEDTLFGCP
jgi:hypothetical protein